MNNLKICPKCNKAIMQYLDNEKNNLTFLICPKCCYRLTDDYSELYITVAERIEQGYTRYERAEEQHAHYIREHYILNNEDEDF